MKKFGCLLIVSCLLLAARAQDTATIHLHVFNKAGTPLASATVELRTKADSMLAKVQLAGADGLVIFENLQRRDYFFRVSHAGFTSVSTPVVSFNGNYLTIPIVMEPFAADLSGVTITAQKSFVEIMPGKTVVNVEAGITTAGTTAMETLEKLPGITVDKDGRLSLKGKAGVMVLIDGRQTYLDASQLSTLLNGMSASQINQIEIMTQPPAGYDAAGNAGVINIKTKKGQQSGFNGSVTAGFSQGFYPKSNNNLQLNYRQGKWNLFVVYSANLNKSRSDIYALRTYFRPDGAVASLLEQPSFFKGTGNTHNLRTGADYAMSEKTSVGLTLTGLALDRNSVSVNKAIWLNPQGQTDSLIETDGGNGTKWRSASGNLNLHHVFTASRELTANVDLIGYRLRGNQAIENRSLFPNPYTEASRADIPSDIRIVSAKADYAEQLKTVRLESGIKTAQIHTDNLAAYEIREAAQWKPDYGKSNHFLYNENIQAAYVNAVTKKRQWNLQAGLRFEATAYDANQLGNPLQKDSSFSRRYNSWFPSAMATFEADSNNSFSISAARRIDRPGFQKLNPFIFIINKYTYQKGNPYYRPQYTWTTEVSHSYKSVLVTTFGYSLTTDYFSQIFPLNSNGLVIYTEGNLGRLQQFTLSLGTQVSPLSWWSLSGQGVAVHKEMEGVIGTKMHSSITQFQLNLNNQFRWQKGWSGEISGFYTSRAQDDIQEFLDPAGQLSAGLAKSILKNKGTLKVSVRDVFHTQWMKGNTFFPGATEYFKITRDSRMGQLTFTYRFGKAYKTNKRFDGSADEETKRVGNGQ